MSTDMVLMSTPVADTGVAPAHTYVAAAPAAAWLQHDIAVKPNATKPVTIGFLRSHQRPEEVSP